jgi:hypothetical protein
VLLTIERAVATIRSSDPGEMHCHSVGTWHGPTAGEELLMSRTAAEAMRRDGKHRPLSVKELAPRLPKRAWQSYMPSQAVPSL